MITKDLRFGDVWLMRYRKSGDIVRVRIVSIYQTAVEVEQRSNLIGWQRPEILSHDAVVFIEKVRDKP